MTTSRIHEFFSSAPARGWQRGRAGKLGTWKICAVLLLCAGTAIGANPVPFVNQPLVPDAAAPGGPGFTLTVNGTGFVPSSIVLWNGSPQATQFVSQGQLTATIPATDVAKAGTASVTVFSPAPGGGASRTLFFSVTEPVSSVSFTETAFGSVGYVGLVTADFNRDGKLDLAGHTFWDDTVAVFLGNGDGTFAPGAIYDECAAAGLPNMAMGDFNGDGFVDLVTGGCGEVTILLGNGDGTFRQGGSFAVGGPGPGNFAVGDFNRDGKLDIAVADANNYVSVLFGNGDGTFQTPVDYDLNDEVQTIAVGDFDGDGNLDLAVGGTSAVYILLGSSDGVFRNGTAIPLATTNAHDLIAVDLNGDGKLDLPLADGYLNQLTVMLGNGDGTFRDGGDYPTPGIGPNAPAAADFRANGILDLVVPQCCGNANVSYYEGNGDGTFQAPVVYPAGFAVRSPTVGDFNGDGRLDMAVGNQYADNILIFLNLPPGPAVTFTPPSLTFASQPVGTLSQSQPVTLTNTGSETLTFSAVASTSGDFYQGNNCPHSLGPQASCTLSVIFTPTVAGSRAGLVNVSDNAAGSPQKLPLTGTASGTGKIVLTLSPASLDFGSVAVGGTSNPQTVTVTNIGSVAASFVHPFGFNTAGADCSDFQITSQCGTSLAPNGSCQVMVTFAPKASGTRAGTFAALQGARSVYIPLSGTGQ